MIFLPKLAAPYVLHLTLAASFAVLTASNAIAQERSGPMTLTAKPIRGGAYWLDGGRSNTGFVIGKTGVVIIDAQMSPDTVKQELAAIAKLTDLPVSTIIATHADPDHVAGISFYPPSARVIEHENTWSEVTASAADPAAGPMWGPLYKKLLERPPSKTIANTETLVIDGVRMTLMYVAPAHTSGDLVIYLPAQKIVYAGDIIANIGRYPIVHLGGSSLGWIATMKAILALDATTYVGGHGAFETRAQLQTRVRDAEDRRVAVKAMVEANKSLAEVEAALPEPGASPLFLTYTRTVFDELTKGYPVASPPWLNLVKK